MQNIISTTSGLAPNMAISLLDLSLSLLLALLLGFVVMIIYRFINLSASYDNSYEFSLIIIPSIVAVVMIFIGSNLALSIGMVGSLSIIRFRTVIKNTIDMVFLFWVIAIGLGCGTYNWIVVIFFTFALSFIIILLNIWRNKFNKESFSETVLIISGSPKINVEEIRRDISTYFPNFKLRSVDKSNSASEYVYHISDYKLSQNKISLEKLIDTIKSRNDVTKVSVLSPELNYSN